MKKKYALCGLCLSAVVGVFWGCAEESSPSGGIDNAGASEERNTIVTLDQLPDCSSKRNGDILFVVKEQQDYQCKNGRWLLVDASSVKECTEDNEGTIWHSTDKDADLECLDGEWVEQEKSSSSKTVRSSSSKASTPDDDVDDDEDVLPPRSSSCKVSSSSSRSGVIVDICDIYPDEKGCSIDEEKVESSSSVASCIDKLSAECLVGTWMLVSQNDMLSGAVYQTYAPPGVLEIKNDESFAYTTSTDPSSHLMNVSCGGVINYGRWSIDESQNSVMFRVTVGDCLYGRGNYTFEVNGSHLNLLGNLFQRGDAVWSGSSDVVEVLVRKEDYTDYVLSSSSRSRISSSSVESSPSGSKPAEKACREGDTYDVDGVEYICEDGEMVLVNPSGNSSSSRATSSSGVALSSAGVSSAAENCTELVANEIVLSNSLGTDQYAINLRTGSAENPDFTINFERETAYFIPSEGVLIVEENNNQIPGLLPPDPVCLEDFVMSLNKVDEVYQSLWVMVKTAYGQVYPMLVKKISFALNNKGSVLITYYSPKNPVEDSSTSVDSSSDDSSSSEDSSPSTDESSSSGGSSASDSPAKPVVKIPMAPFYFEDVAEDAQQAYWDRLMEYKVFGREYVLLGDRDVHFQVEWGKFGSGSGNVKLGENGGVFIAGPIVAGGNVYVIGAGDTVLTGPIHAGERLVVINPINWYQGSNIFAGDVCAKNGVSEIYVDEMQDEYSVYFGDNYQNCPGNVPSLDLDLTIPEVDFGAVENIRPSIHADNMVAYIDVPPGEGAYDLHVESIVMRNHSTLIVRMPEGGRLTRIFTNELVVAGQYAIQTAVMERGSTYDFELNRWTGSVRVLDGSEYMGNLMIYSSSDVFFPASLSAVVQGTIVVPGSLYLGAHGRFAGQFIAGSIVIEEDFSCRSVPWNPSAN